MTLKTPIGAKKRKVVGAFGRTSDITRGDAMLRAEGLEGVGGSSMGVLKTERRFEPVFEMEAYQHKRGGRIHRGFKSKYETRYRQVRRPDQAVYDYAFAGPQSSMDFSNEGALELDRSFNPGVTSAGLTGNASDKSMNQMGGVTSAAPMGGGQTSIGMTGDSSEQSINEKIDEAARGY